MNQQRSRRFRTAQEAKEKEANKAELLKMLKAQNGGVLKEGAGEEVVKKAWDSNAITPGTPFMFKLAACLRYWCAYKLNTDPGWEGVKVIISDASVPGEGEHKIMEFIRSQRSDPLHDPNTHHVMCGLDADLIMLGLATHEPHFHVLREDVFFQEAKARTCRLCGQKGHMAEQCTGEAKQKDGEYDEKDAGVEAKPFIWLHVSVLREYLAAELEVPVPFHWDLERALDDWVFMCFFVGNDFLPHLPSLDIKENGIDTLIAIWRDNLPLMGGFVTRDGQVDLAKAQFILNGLAKQEDAIFKKRREIDQKKENAAKRRKVEEENRNRRQSGRSNSDFNSPKRNGNNPPTDLPMFAPGKGETIKDLKPLTHDMVVNRNFVQQTDQANKSAAAELKSRLLQKSTENGAQADATGDANSSPATSPASSLKRKADALEEDGPSTPGRETPVNNGTPKADPEGTPDTVRLWEDGYADRYYEQKFHKDPSDIAFRHHVAKHYVEGLAWVLLYYMQGCPSWTWYYPFHYAPFAADFVELEKMDIKFNKGKPFRPYEQLMGVLPAASNHVIPDVFKSLMTDEDSPILDFYPEDFPLDLNGKKFAWQGVVLLPFIDENRLLEAMGTRYPQLTPEEVERNEVGRNVLIFSDKNALYNDATSNFYSKRQGAPKYKLDSKISKGLAGKIEKNPDYLPQSALVYPLPAGGMPDLDEDRSLRYVPLFVFKPIQANGQTAYTTSGRNPTTSTSLCSLPASSSTPGPWTARTSNPRRAAPGPQVAPSAAPPSVTAGAVAEEAETAIAAASLAAAVAGTAAGSTMPPTVTVAATATTTATRVPTPSRNTCSPASFPRHTSQTETAAMVLVVAGAGGNRTHHHSSSSTGATSSNSSRDTTTATRRRLSTSSSRTVLHRNSSKAVTATTVRRSIRPQPRTAAVIMPEARRSTTSSRISSTIRSSSSISPGATSGRMGMGISGDEVGVGRFKERWNGKGKGGGREWWAMYAL